MPVKGQSMAQKNVGFAGEFLYGGHLTVCNNQPLCYNITVQK